MVSLRSLATGTQGGSLVCVSLRCVLRRAPFVRMQAADLQNLLNGTICERRDWTRNGRIFVQREVRVDRSSSWLRFSTFSLHVSSDNAIGSLTRWPYGWISCAC